MKKALRYFVLGVLLVSCEKNQNSKESAFGKREINTEINTDSLKKEKLRYTIINDANQATYIANDSIIFWTPTEKQVDEVMAILRKTIINKDYKHARYLKADSLGRAYKQIICYKDNNGDSLVFINGLCRISDFPKEDSKGNFKFYRDDWQNRLIEVKDGGDCYWYAVINYSQKKSLSLNANGDA